LNQQFPKIKLLVLFRQTTVLHGTITHPKHRTFTQQNIALLHTQSIALLHDKNPHFYTAGVSYFYPAKVSFFVVLQPCFLDNKKPEVWEVNFTAIERKITQQKCEVPVLFLRTFTQQKHTLVIGE
jgi:hypothetical protein